MDIQKFLAEHQGLTFIGVWYAIYFNIYLWLIVAYRRQIAVAVNAALDAVHDGVIEARTSLSTALVQLGYWMMSEHKWANLVIAIAVRIRPAEAKPVPVPASRVKSRYR